MKRLESLSRWLPWWDEVSPITLRDDVVAGLLGALLVLPQGIAFATLAGLPPQYGLASAVLPCILAALFGSSRHVVTGPTNANSLALLAMLSPLALAGTPHYVELALAVTVMVGLMQGTLALLRLGAVAHFIAPSVLLGFTSGAAVLIGVQSLRDLLDAGVPRGLDAMGVLSYTVGHLEQINPAAAAVAAVTAAVALLMRRYAPRWPGMLIALGAGTAAALLLRLPGRWPITLLGALPSPWPSFHLPSVSLDLLPTLFDKALALSVVALGQSISIAKALAARSGQRVDTNREFFGQGVANTVGGLFSCYLSCGSLNRSMPNLEAGARTPLAAVLSGAMVLVLVLAGAPLLARIPLPAIAALLMVVAFTLVDTAGWRRLARDSRTELYIASITLAAALTLRLETAILLGTGLSIVTYLYRTSRPAMRTMGFDRKGYERRFVVLDTAGAAAGAVPGGRGSTLPECPQIKLLRMEGPVYFGATAHVEEHLHALRETTGQRHLLVMAKSMNFIDLAGSDVWRAELRERRAAGGDLYFHRPREQVVRMWARTRFLEELGKDHVFPDKRTAIGTIFQRLDRSICETCTVRLFWECEALVLREVNEQGGGI